MNRFAIVKSNQSGLSLVEVLAAVGIASAVSLLIGYLLLSSQTQMVSVQNQSTMDRIHSINTQLAQSTRFIALYLPVPAGRATCFDGSSPGGCGDLSTGGFQAVADYTAAPPGDDVARPFRLPFQNVTAGCAADSSRVDCGFESRIEFNRICTPASCTEAQVRITTRPRNAALGEAGGFKADMVAKLGTRVNVYSFPIQAVQSQTTLKFNCLGGGVVGTGLTNVNMTVTCDPIPVPSSCVNNMPMGNFTTGLSTTTACQDVTTRDCTTATRYGYRRFAIGRNESFCRRSH